MEEEPIEVTYDVKDIIASEDSDMESNYLTIKQLLLKNTQDSLKKIEKVLYKMPSFVNYIKANIPEKVYKSILSRGQQEQIAKGAIKMMEAKNGKGLFANLVDTKTNKIVGNVPLEEIKHTPELTKSINDFAIQAQMAQIAENIEVIRLAVEEVKQGLEYDRLAIANSCEQRFLQISKMSNKQLKISALLSLITDAENSRNQLMLSQKTNLDVIKKQPEKYVGKFLNGLKQEKIDERLEQIRESLSAISMVSLIEAISYQEMGELEAAKTSLRYYESFLNKMYLNDKKLIERLDLLDSSPRNYWTKNLPKIETSIKSLMERNNKLIGGEKNGNRKKM